MVFSLFPQILTAQPTPSLTLTGKTQIDAPLPDFKQVFFLQNPHDSITIKDLIISTFPLWVSGSDSVVPNLKITPVGAPSMSGSGSVGPVVSRYNSMPD